MQWGQSGVLPEGEEGSALADGWQNNTVSVLGAILSIISRNHTHGCQGLKYIYSGPGI